MQIQAIVFLKQAVGPLQIFEGLRVFCHGFVVQVGNFAVKSEAGGGGDGEKLERPWVRGSLPYVCSPRWSAIG